MKKKNGKLKNDYDKQDSYQDWEEMVAVKYLLKKAIKYRPKEKTMEIQSFLKERNFINR